MNALCNLTLVVVVGAALAELGVLACGFWNQLMFLAACAPLAYLLYYITLYALMRAEVDRHGRRSLLGVVAFCLAFFLPLAALAVDMEGVLKWLTPDVHLDMK